jgi:signal transduction histidine kinase
MQPDPDPGTPNGVSNREARSQYLMQLLATTARAMLADPKGSRAPQRAVAAVTRALPDTDASVFLKARGRSPLTWAAAAGADFAERPRAEGDGVADILTVAFARHTRVLAGPQGDAALPARWQEAGIRWAAAVALRSSRHTFGGLIVRGRDEGPPDGSVLAFIEGIADVTALALAARSAPALAGPEGDRSVVLDALFRCQEMERARISRELHDEANQSLTSLILGLSVLDRQVQDPAAREQIAQLRERAVQTLDGLKRVAKGLRPPALDELGLGAALRALCESFTTDHGIRADFYHVDVNCPCRSRFVDIAIYRIVQEALTNVARHAEATQVAVVQACRQGLVTVQIEDNGTGIMPEEDEAPSGTCIGLLGMTERAAVLGGRVRVEAVPGKGTTVYVEIPADFVDQETQDEATDPIADSR